MAQSSNGVVEEERDGETGREGEYGRWMEEGGLSLSCKLERRNVRGERNVSWCVLWFADLVQQNWEASRASDDNVGRLVRTGDTVLAMRQAVRVNWQGREDGKEKAKRESTVMGWYAVWNT